MVWGVMKQSWEKDWSYRKIAVYRMSVLNVPKVVLREKAKTDSLLL